MAEVQGVVTDIFPQYLFNCLTFVLTIAVLLWLNWPMALLSLIIFVTINTLIVLGYGGLLVLDGSITVGSLVAFSIYQGRLLGPMQGIMDGYLAIQKSKIALFRVREILDIPKSIIGSGSGTIEARQFAGKIRFDGVCFGYEPATPLFENLSLTIPAGRVTTLVGPSGMGKTTLCHLILRLIDPDAGRITLDGIDLKDLDMDWYRKQIALVSQDTVLFHTSILENIRFARPEAPLDAVVAAARSACIDEFIKTLPDGYDTNVVDRGLRLSGGQKQRISIARAILLDPKILILDEATAFLDTGVEEQLRQTIQQLMKNRVVLVVSRRRSTISGADQVISLDHGGKIIRRLKTGTG